MIQSDALWLLAELSKAEPDLKACRKLLRAVLSPPPTEKHFGPGDEDYDTSGD